MRIPNKNSVLALGSPAPKPKTEKARRLRMLNLKISESEGPNSGAEGFDCLHPPTGRHLLLLFCLLRSAGESTKDCHLQRSLLWPSTPLQLPKPLSRHSFDLTHSHSLLSSCKLEDKEYPRGSLALSLGSNHHPFPQHSKPNTLAMQ